MGKIIIKEVKKLGKIKQKDVDTKMINTKIRGISYVNSVKILIATTVVMANKLSKEERSDVLALLKKMIEEGEESCN